jgi:Rps23 Pro-64 3,4-dihydroxylase Tpa1-like proline 4-hydroxylase
VNFPSVHRRLVSSTFSSHQSSFPSWRFSPAFQVSSSIPTTLGKHGISMICLATLLTFKFFLFSGGLHQTLPGGHLSIHADFNWHGGLHMWRRVNVFLYLNPDWDPAWGGELQLWDSMVGDMRKTISPTANTLVIFSSSDNVRMCHLRCMYVCTYEWMNEWMNECMYVGTTLRLCSYRIVPAIEVI